MLTKESKILIKKMSSGNQKSTGWHD